MSTASLGIMRRASVAAVIVWIFGWGASNAVEPMDHVLVADAAGQSSETANRMVVSAYSQDGDTESLKAFQQVSSEAVTLLAEIEDENLAGKALSETRDRFQRIAHLLGYARHLIDEGKIHVEPLDEAELAQLLSVLDQQYSPRPEPE